MVIETSGVKINSNNEELSSLSVMPTAAERQEKYGYQFPQFRDEFSYSYGRWEKPKEEGSVWTAPFRGAAFGTDQLVTGGYKLWEVGSNTFKDGLRDIFRSKKYDFLYGELEGRLQEGLISQEDYDTQRADLDKQFYADLDEASQRATFETEEAKALVDAINKNTEKRMKDAWYAKGNKDGVFFDMFAAAPTMVAAGGVLALTKNPILAGATMAALSSTSTMSDVVDSELQNGNTLQGALSTGAVTGAAVGSLDALGGVSIMSMFRTPAKRLAFNNRLLNEVISWVRQDNVSTSFKSYLGRVVLGSGAEEFTTESVQDALQANLPRLLGKGEEWKGFSNEIGSYLYSGFIGALSGGLFGGTGAAFSYRGLHKSLQNFAIEHKATKEEAKNFADQLTPALAEKGQEVMREYKEYAQNQVAGKDKLNELSEIDTILKGGLTEQEAQEMDHIYLQKLNKLHPENQETNEITAQLLTQKQQIEADLLGVKAENVEVEVTDNSQDISSSDTYLHDVQDGQVQGATPKDISSKMIYLVKGASAETILHEAAHQYLNSVSKVLQKARVRGMVNPTISGIIDVIGEPDANGMFSTEQQEKFAKTLSATVLAQKGVPANLAGAVNGAKKLVNTIYKAAEKGNKTTESLQVAYSKIFAKDMAKTPVWELTKERVAELKTAADNLKKGGKATIEQIKMLAQLIKFGQGYIPAFNAVTLREFIDRTPNYNTLTAVEKLALLEEKGFKFERNEKLYPTVDGFVKFLEANADNVESRNAEQIKAQKDRFENYKAAYMHILGGTRVEIANLASAMRKITQAGLAVVAPENLRSLNNSINALSKAVKSLEKKAITETEKAKMSAEKVAEYEKEELARERKTTNQIADFILQLQGAFNLIGEDLGGLDTLARKAKENASSGKIDEIKEFNRTAIAILRDKANKFFSKYYQSATFLQVNKIEPPIVSEGKLLAELTNAVTKTYDVTDPNNTAKMIKEVSKSLVAMKVPLETRSAILEDLIKNYSKLATGNITEIATGIINRVNENYQTQMKARIDKAINEIFTDARKGNFDNDTNVAFNFINDTIKEYRKYLKNPKNWDAVNYEFWQSRKNFDEVIAKDPTGKEIRLNNDQKQFLARLIDYETALANAKRKTKNPDFRPLSNNELISLYRDIQTLATVTADYTTKLQMEEEAKLNEQAHNLAEIVRSRKVIPVITPLDKLLFAGPLGGFRSNMIAMFGQEEANKLDVIVDDRGRNIATKNMIDDLNKTIKEEVGFNVWGYRGRLNTRVPFKNATDKIGLVLKDYTKGQLMQLYMLSKNELGIRHLNNQFIELGHEQGKAVVDYIIKHHGLSKIDIAIADKMMSQLESLYPDIAAVYFRINKEPLGRQANYWPVKVKKVSMGKDVIQDDITMFEAKPTEQKGFRNTQKRTGPALGDKLVLDNPIDTYTTYLENANKFIAMTEKINRVSQLLQNEELKTAISEKFGDEFLKAFQRDIEYMLGVSYTEPATQMSKLLNEFVSNWTIGKLGLKVWVGAKQIPAFIAYAEKMPIGAFSSYLFTVLQNPIKMFKYMKTNYPSFMNRAQGALPMAFFDNKSLLMDTMLGENKTLRKFLGERKLEKVSQGVTWFKDKATSNIRWGDTIAVLLGGGSYVLYLQDMIQTDPVMSKWSKARQQQFIEEKLIEATETTQQSGLMSARGSLQRGNSVLKRALLSFSSAQAQYARKIREALYLYANGEISRVDLFKRIIIYTILNPLAYAFLSQTNSVISAFKGLFGGDDDDKEEVYRGLIRPMIENITGAYGSIGNIFLMPADAIAKRTGQAVWGDDNSIEPGILSDIRKAFGELSKEDIDWSNFALDTAQILTPLPLQTSKKMLQGTKELFNDEEKVLGIAKILGISENQVKKLLEDK